MQIGKPIVIGLECSNKLANAGFVCACLVVAQHVRPVLAVGSFGKWIYDAIISGGFAAAAVPMFFCISGFLFAGRMEGRGWWWRQVSSRLKSLLVPYLIWCMGFYIYEIVLALAAPKIGSNFVGLDLSSLSILGGVVDMFGLDPMSVPQYGNLWFLRDLFVIVLMLPLIVRGMGWGSIAAIFIVKELVQMSDLSANFAIRGWIRGCLWFSIGIALRYHPMSAVVKSEKVRVFAASALWLFLFAMARNSMWSLEVRTLLSCILIWSLVPTSKWESVAGYAFPVYLIHGFFALLLPALAKRIPSFHDSIFGWGIIVFVLICLSCLATRVLCRALPRFSNLLFGGRIAMARSTSGNQATSQSVNGNGD